MKQVRLEVIANGVSKTISISFKGDTMPKELDNFIVEHIGGRPKDRK